MIPLLDRRLGIRGRLQALQDGVGILALVPAALARLGDGQSVDVGLAAVELAAAFGMTIAVVRDLRDGGERHGVGWTGILSGIVLLADGGFRVAHGHRPFNPQIVVGVLLLVLGVLRPTLAARMEARRRIRLYGGRVRARLTPLRAFDVAWADVTALEMTEGRIRLRTQRSGYTIRLRHYLNAAQIRAALVAAARAAGVAVRGARHEAPDIADRGSLEA